MQIVFCKQLGYNFYFVKELPAVTVSFYSFTHDPTEK